MRDLIGASIITLLTSASPAGDTVPYRDLSDVTKQSCFSIIDNGTSGKFCIGDSNVDGGEASVLHLLGKIPDTFIKDFGESYIVDEKLKEIGFVALNGTNTGYFNVSGTFTQDESFNESCKTPIGTGTVSNDSMSFGGKICEINQ